MKRLSLIELFCAGCMILTMSSCSTLNPMVSAGLGEAKQDYSGTKQNLEALNDAKVQVWLDIAKTLPIGALQRNPEAAKVVLQAVPIPGYGRVTINQDTGAVNVQMGATK